MQSKRLAPSECVSWAELVWKTIGDVPFVFVWHHSLRHSDRKVAQRVALLTSFLRKITPYVAPDPEAARRLALAQLHGAEDKLIASAELQGGTLEVWSCEPKVYRVPIADLPALSKLPRKALNDFTVSSSGSRLHWNAADVDLDLEGIRAAIDPTVAARHREEFRKETVRYGRAIRALRQEKKIKQADVKGITERTLRRIETGTALPHSSTLTKLAAAHGMTLSEYMAALATRM